MLCWCATTTLDFCLTGRFFLSYPRPHKSKVLRTVWARVFMERMPFLRSNRQRQRTEYICLCVDRFVDRMAKFDFEAMKKKRLAATTTLKSTGQSKFALEEEVKPKYFCTVIRPRTKYDMKSFSAQCIFVSVAEALRCQTELIGWLGGCLGGWSDYLITLFSSNDILGCTIDLGGRLMPRLNKLISVLQWAPQWAVAEDPSDEDILFVH